MGDRLGHEAADVRGRDHVWLALRAAAMASGRAPGRRRWRSRRSGARASAAASAASSIRLPRETLIRKAEGFIQPSSSAPIRFSVSSVATARHDHEVGLDQQRAEVGLAELGLDHPDVGIADQDALAQRLAELGEPGADVAVADDAEGAAAQLPAHARGGGSPLR